MSKSLHRRRLSCSLVLAFGLLATGGLALVAGATPVRPPGDPAATAALTTPGKLVVAVAPGFAEDDLRAILARDGAILEQWLPRLGLALISMPVGNEMAVAEALDAELFVDFVAPHRKLARIADVPLDQYWSQQWGPAEVQGPAAWDLAWADPSIIIADVDTGVNQEQLDLQGRTWRNPGESGVDPVTGGRTCAAPIAYNGVDDDNNDYIDDCQGWDFVASDKNPTDEYGHGTAVAGIAAATTDNPGLQVPGIYEGIAGMARQASLMALRVLDSSGLGSSFDITAGIDYATANGAGVVNLSLTFPPYTSPDSAEMKMLRRAVEAAQAAGVLLVAAAGNENYNGIDYPAKFPGVLAVGASTQDDARASFSNYGSRLDLVAPGVGIFSTLYAPGLNSYGLFHGTGNGTSYAAPHASGVAALVRGLRPDLAQGAVYELIRRTADDVGAAGFDPQTGWGRLNAARAVSEAVAGLRLGLVADPPSVAVNGDNSVRLRITAPSGVPAGLGARVTLTGSLGSITPTLVTVDSAGRASAIFTAGSLMGTAHVTATLGGVSVTLPLTITSGLPAGLDLSAAPAAIPSGGAQAAITATVRDEEGSVAAVGIAVTFTTDLGGLCATGGACPSPVGELVAFTAGGIAKVKLVSGNTSGTAHVCAVAASLPVQVMPVVFDPGPPSALVLRATPESVLPGGRVALAATVRDVFGNTVADGTPVYFYPESGSLERNPVPTEDGVALNHLDVPARTGSIRITAGSGGASGFVMVQVVNRRAIYLPGVYHAWLWAAGTGVRPFHSFDGHHTHG